MFLFVTITSSLPDEDFEILPPVVGSIKSIREKTYYLNQAVQEVFQVFYYSGEILVFINNNNDSIISFNYYEDKIVKYNNSNNQVTNSDNAISYD